MSIAPDNFLYFITIFTTAIFSGTYLLFSYYRNRLLLLNVLLFYLTGIVASSEFYLQQVNSFPNATNIYIIHNLCLILFGVCLWTCIWFYIRPFRTTKKEKVVNYLYLYGLIVPILLVGIYGFYNNHFYYLNPEKIESYWMSTINEGNFLTQVFIFNCAITMNVIVVILFLIAIFRDRKDMIRLGVLLLFHIVVPIVYYTTIVTITQGKWRIPSLAFILFAESAITTWFVSNYRIFNNSFKAANLDLLNSISDLAISTDSNLLVSNANKKATSFFSDIQQGNSIIGVIADNSTLTFKQINEKIQRLIQAKKGRFEFNLIDRQEKERIFEIKTSPLTKDEQIEGYTFLLTDLSEVRQKELELQSLSETKDRLFAIISHDLRRPANAFRGISKKVRYLIQRQEFERLDKFGIHIEKEAFSLSRLLDNLLSWALQQRALLPYHPVSLKVQEVTAKIQQLYQPIAEDKGITLVMNIEEATTVFSDPNSFKSIIRNLVDNAIKYTPVGGTIEVSSTKWQEQVLIKVVDTGIGMEQTTIDTIFDLKMDKSEQGTEGELGVGLGLSLVRDLVALNKGTIKVSSQWNEGTTFEVLLPTK